MRGFGFVAKAMAGAFALWLAMGVAASAADAPPQKRVALVIGNGDYAFAPKLDNPTLDAKAVAEALRRLGFEVTEGYNLTSAEMREKMAIFAATLADSQAALVFYGGHGVSVDDENYLLPVDIRLKSPADLDLNALGVSLILRQMRREERVNVVILDACRDNPFAADLARAKTRAIVGERGLSRVEGDLARGALIAFASDPKSVALDGAAGDHSPFTKALLHHIEDAGVPIDTVMSRVRSEVWEETHNRQLPWVNTSIIGEFELNPAAPIAASAPAPAASPATAPDRRAEEYLMWESAQRSNLASDYQVYLDAYPNGVFAAMARNRIAALAPTPRQPTPPAAKPANTVEAELGTEDAEQSLALDLAARKEIQLRLAALGLDSGIADGDFGDKTRGAIRAWQERRRFVATGRLGPLQLAELKSESEGAYRRALAALTPPREPAPHAPPAPRPALRARPLPVRQAPRAAAANAPIPQPAPAQPAGPDSRFAPEITNGLRALSDSLGALGRPASQ